MTTTTIEDRFSVDELHVLSDALIVLRDSIVVHHDIEPWTDYDARDDDDPKCHRDSYLNLIALASERVTAVLSRAQFTDADAEQARRLRRFRVHQNPANMGRWTVQLFMPEMGLWFDCGDPVATRDEAVAKLRREMGEG